MATKDCSCKSNPSISIMFGAPRAKSTTNLNRIVPLGLVMPAPEKIIDYVFSVKPHVPSPDKYLDTIEYQDDEMYETVKFKFTVNYCTIDSFSVVITARHRDTKQEIPIIKQVTTLKDASSTEHGSLPCGEYFWEWDGFADLTPFLNETKLYDEEFIPDEYTSDVLNTSFLKTHKLKIHFTYNWKSSKNEQKTASYSRGLVGKPYTKNTEKDEDRNRYKSRDDKYIDYVDTVVNDKQNKKVRIIIRQTMKDDLSKGCPRTYAELVAMAKAGLENIWCRNGNDRGTDIIPPYWDLTPSQHKRDTFLVRKKNEKLGLICRAIIAQKSQKRFKSNLPIKWSDDTDPPRSVSYGPTKKIYYYTWGRPNHKGGLDYCDLYFHDLTAHEVGHSIIEDAYTRNYSWSHKGCTNYFQQETTETKKNKVHRDINSLPIGSYVEYDVMRYNITDGIESFGHTVATVDDTRGAVFISQVVFEFS